MSEICEMNWDHLPKYHQDAPFNDPLLICDSCNEIERTAVIRNSGRCTSCGNRKFRNVQVINAKQWEKIKEWNIDPDFLKLFEVMNNE